MRHGWFVSTTFVVGDVRITDRRAATLRRRRLHTFPIGFSRADQRYAALLCRAERRHRVDEGRSEPSPRRFAVLRLW